MGIKNFVAIAAGVLLSLAIVPHAEGQHNSSVLSSGQYSQVTVDEHATIRTERLDDWRMTILRDGSYCVDSQLASDPTGRSHEHHLFTSDFRPMGFSMLLATVDTSSLRISCTYGQSETACKLESGTQKTETKMQEKMPYAFVPFPEQVTALYDGPWFYQMLLSQAERSPLRHTSIPLVTFQNDKLIVKKTLDVAYLGREQIEVLGKKIFAHKYHVVDPNDPKRPAQDLWMSTGGILLKATPAYLPAVILTAYEGPMLN
jgi:hypothetical protein